MASSVLVLFRREVEEEETGERKKREQNLFFVPPVFVDTEENTYSDCDLIGMIWFLEGWTYC